MTGKGDDAQQQKPGGGFLPVCVSGWSKVDHQQCTAVPPHQLLLHQCLPLLHQCLKKKPEPHNGLLALLLMLLLTLLLLVISLVWTGKVCWKRGVISYSWTKATAKCETFARGLQPSLRGQLGMASRVCTSTHCLHTHPAALRWGPRRWIDAEAAALRASGGSRGR